MPKKKKSEKKTDDNYTPNDPKLLGAPDLSMLVYLDMKNVLVNCEHRYCKMPRKHCYTSISTILLAINPYERLPIYGEDVINEFHAHYKRGRLPSDRPHPYGVSARSYMRMVQRKANQSIIVCGESGAGKTETTKLLMRYLAMTAPSTTMESSMIEQQIIAASPILEAYGNAKTVMNNNSSRFGKFTKLLYHCPKKAKEGSILGSFLETYLLEKSRVVFQSPNERNYHIPYFLHTGIPKDKYDDYCLSNAKDFHYARQGNCVEVPGISDLSRYEELQESLKLMRIDEALQPALWSLTMGIFHLGNIEFKKEGDGFASLHKDAGATIKKVVKLWQVDEKALVKRLTTNSIKIMKKTVEKKIKFEDAPTNRDSISKGIYERIFLWLGDRINAELYQTDETDETSILFIGILDVFGFENFWINSMEQFCINFTNEKLQQFFNYHIIKSEQEEYIKESVFWTPIKVPDNKEYMKMVENKDSGFYTLLDSACKAPQPDVKAFMQELFKRHKDCKALKIAKAPGSGNARGGPAKDVVTYDASKFLTKNMEAVHPDTAKMMKKSKVGLISQIAGKKEATKKKLTVTGKFWKGIKTLMKNLKATEPYFVRCVNPNMVKSSKVWTESVVEHQLRCGGLVEALKVLKLGYPTRVPYTRLYDSFHSSVQNPLVKNMGPESFSTALLIAFDVSEADYELGLTKIFFKPAKAAVLDTIMNSAGKPLTAAQNEKITKWVVQKRIKQMVGCAKAFLELRKRVRLNRAEKRWEFCGRVASILAGTVIRHLTLAREAILKRKREAGALALQSYFRGNYERMRYRKHIDKVKKACKMIWISYRRWNDRVELKKWIDPKVEATRKRKEAERKKREEEERQRKLEEERIRRENAKEEERMKRQKELEEARKKREEERKKKEEEEKRKREEEEKERLRKEEEERKRKEEEEKKKREEEEKKKKEEEEQKKKEAEKRQKAAAADLEKQKKEKEKEKHKQEREAREASIKIKKSKRRKAERRRKEKKAEEFEKKNFPERYADSDEEDDDGDDSESYSTDDSFDEQEATIEQQLKHFDKTAATGQLFLKYTGKRRRKPQDRIVKVSFDNKAKPKQISWGSGSRHLDFSDILYIAWGHWTPVFQARKDQLDPKLCFSVVGKQQVLDVQATNKKLAELWVKGLRRLIGHSDKQDDKLAKESLENGNLPGSSKDSGTTGKKKQEKEHKKRTKSLMLLQQDLFVMTTTTVFRNLEEERIWDIDNSIREKFNPKVLYELALREDVPWRQWNHWIRDKIVTYLRENNRVSKPQGNPYGQPQQQFGMQQQPQYNPNAYQQPQQQYYQQPQPQYQAQPQQYGHMNKQGSMYGQQAFQQPKPQQQYGHMKQQGSVYGQQAFQQPPQQAAPVMPQNFNMPQLQTPQNFNMPPMQQGGQQRAPNGQPGDQGDCSLM